MEEDLRVAWPFAGLPPSLVLVEAGFDVQPSLSHIHSGPAQAVTNCGLLSSCKQVAQDQS